MNSFAFNISQQARNDDGAHQSTRPAAFQSLLQPAITQEAPLQKALFSGFAVPISSPAPRGIP